MLLRTAKQGVQVRQEACQPHSVFCSTVELFLCRIVTYASRLLSSAFSCCFINPLAFQSLMTNRLSPGHSLWNSLPGHLQVNVKGYNRMNKPSERCWWLPESSKQYALRYVHPSFLLWWLVSLISCFVSDKKKRFSECIHLKHAMIFEALFFFEAFFKPYKGKITEQG